MRQKITVAFLCKRCDICDLAQISARDLDEQAFGCFNRWVLSPE